jgi:L-asparaginase/Glu-tRNA(Gln) amidotransferase subunit D
MDAVGAGRLDHAHYTETRARFDEGQLVDSLPELHGIAVIHEVPCRRVSSRTLTTEDWLRLARTTQEFLDGDHDSVVITHGTNTLEGDGRLHAPGAATRRTRGPRVPGSR